MQKVLQLLKAYELQGKGQLSIGVMVFGGVVVGIYLRLISWLCLEDKMI